MYIEKYVIYIYIYIIYFAQCMAVYVDVFFFV